MLHSPSTSGHPLSGTYRLSGLPGTRSNALPGAAPMSNGQEHSEIIQMATETGNIRGMYDGIKKALGPIQSKTAPLKSATGEVITDQGWQMERWVEHYSNLYSRENTVIPSAWVQSSACQSWKSSM